MAIPNQDIESTLDLSGATEISGADINQVTDTAEPSANKGMTVHSTDTAGVPDVPEGDSFAKYRRYLWIRQTASTTLTYVWDENAVSGALLKWVQIAEASVPDGSITNAKLADNSVSTDKIVDGVITSAKMAPGVIPSSLPPSGAAGGSLTGSYPNPTIANGAVGTTMVANGSVTTAKILDANVTKAKLELLGTRKVVRGSVDGSANELVDLYSQRVTAFLGTAGNSTTVLPYDNSTPAIGEGDDIFGNVSITPQKLGAKLKVNVCINLYIGSAIPMCIALFQDGTCVAASAVYPAAALLSQVVLNYEYTVITNLTARVFTVRYGPGVPGTLYINGDATAKFNGLFKSSITIDEIQA